MQQTVQVGLIGFGMAGEFFHAPLIQAVEGLRLHSIVERSKERSKDKYPDVQIVRNPEELFLNSEIELVVIASPNSTHFEYAKRALLAGKHVVVDKPFTVTVKEGEELIALAERQQKKLTVYQNRRWDGDFLTVQKIIKEGLLGDVLEYEAHFDRYRPAIRPDSWKEEAGILYDLGPHLLDQALVLFGKPYKITSRIETQRTGALADDFFEIVFQYPNRKAILSAGMLVEKAGPHFSIKGTKGIFTKYGMDPQENLLKTGVLPIGENWGVDLEEGAGTLETENGSKRILTEKGNYPLFYENIYNAIVMGEKLQVDPKESLEVIRIIEEAKRG